MMPSALGAGVFLLLMAGLFIPLEWLFPASPHKPSLRAQGVGAALFVVNALLMEVIGAPLLEAVARASERTAARVILVFVLADLASYWVHRAMHQVPWLWRFHRVHHEAVELSWLDAWRQHPVDFVLHGVIVGLPGAVLGASLGELGSVVVLRKAFTTFLHANVRAPFGPFHWVLASPSFHGAHHQPANGNTNFAGTFPVWDLLFGTALRCAPMLDSAEVTSARAG